MAPRILNLGISVKLTTHILLAPRSRMRGTIPLLPNVSSWRGAYRSTGTTSHYLYAEGG